MKVAAAYSTSTNDQWRSQKQKHSRAQAGRGVQRGKTFSNNTCDLIHNSDVHSNIDNLASTGIL